MVLPRRGSITRTRDTYRVILRSDRIRRTSQAMPPASMIPTRTLCSFV